MFRKVIFTTLVAVALMGKSVLYTPVYGADTANPSISGVVPFFYYDQMDVAADWYEEKLGFERVTDEDWVVIFKIADESYIGLVNATDGSMRPAANKGVMLSIETGELEAWYRKLKELDGINMIQGIEEGAGGMIDEFRLMDPGGYIVEFFRWRSHRIEAEKYNNQARR